MPDIKQPELPFSPLLYWEWKSDNKRHAQTLYTADQMHAHYAKGREDERKEQYDYKLLFDDSQENTLRLAKELAALKQSLAQPAQAAVPEGWKLVKVDHYSPRMHIAAEEAYNNNISAWGKLRAAVLAAINAAPEREGGV